MMLKYWKPLVLIALVAFSWCATYLSGYKKADEHWQIKWSQRDTQDVQAFIQRQIEAREQERLWQKKIGSITDDARRQIDAANRDVNTARAAASGLHDKADKLAKRLAARESACDTQITGRSQAAAGTELLADLFRRADEEAGRMAALADRARIAGLACKNAYDSLKKHPNN